VRFVTTVPPAVDYLRGVKLEHITMKLSSSQSFGFIGDLSGSLAKQAAISTRLTAFSGSLAQLQGVLVDGQAANAAFSGEVAQKVLEAGGVLAISNPGKEHAEILRSIAGQSPAPGAALVTVKKAAGRSGYHFLVVPHGNVKQNSISKQTPLASRAEPLKLNVSAVLARALTSDAPVATVGGGIAAGLIPPPKSECGYSSFQSPVSWTAGPPQINGNNDDSTVGGNSLTIEDLFLTEFYVYWVNGVQNSPYFVVILRQTGPMSLGGTLANNQNSLGYFQTNFNIANNTLTDWNRNPLGQGALMSSYSPGSGNTANIPVSISVPMALYAQTASGMGSVQFDATVNDTLPYSDWAVQDQTSGGNTAWECYQYNDWNVLQNPPDDFGNWWQQVYNGDQVNSMPNMSFGSIPFEMITVYQFNPPLFTPPTTSPFNPPPSMQVGFSGSISQTVSLLHSPDGCNDNPRHHHLFSLSAAIGDWSWGIDLGAIAQQQNLG